MSATIDGRTVDSFNGFMYQGAQRPRTELFGKEGVDGDGMHTLAMRGATIEIPTARDVASVALAEAEIDAYYAMIGTVVTVVDQFGATWTDTKVEDCVAVPTKTLSAYRVLATWTFRPGI
jgi:hypothetical protein